MANIFSNPLVLAETVVGSVIDQRAVVLYAQEDFTDAKKEIIDQKSKEYTGWIGDNISQDLATALTPTVEDYVKKRKLTELFTGAEIPYLSEINGYNMWGISYMNADVNISSNLCDHPIETGQVITDATIRNPISAKVEIVMPTAFYEKLYKQVYDYYESKKKIMLLTKFGLYPNMVIKDMPYKLEHNNVDRPSIALELREIMEVNAEYKIVDSVNTPVIESDKARMYDDTTRTDVGRVFPNAVAEVFSGVTNV